MVTRIIIRFFGTTRLKQVTFAVFSAKLFNESAKYTDSFVSLLPYTSTFWWD